MTIDHRYRKSCRNCCQDKKYNDTTNNDQHQQQQQQVKINLIKENCFQLNNDDQQKTYSENLCLRNSHTTSINDYLLSLDDDDDNNNIIGQSDDNRYNVGGHFGRRFHRHHHHQLQRFNNTIGISTNSLSRKPRVIGRREYRRRLKFGMPITNQKTIKQTTNLTSGYLRILSSSSSSNNDNINVKKSVDSKSIPSNRCRQKRLQCQRLRLKIPDRLKNLQKLDSSFNPSATTTKGMS
ncbi:hypothetical protein DERP_001655 [Dermatophagoides pteronyssinus]|uniref:Uncharacterized protein n=1 Tax=Dermatophagoides pteronyssinus TaxID=6956 RepID=A0ABQ8JB70_DERPT|nr:hypothetical protein DERP_001655 [Dermatophagoides pteronyssinus]